MGSSVRVRVEMLEGSRVLVDLRATGILRAVGHDPTLLARPERLAIEADGDGPAIDVPLTVRFAAASIEPPRDISRSDREKMRDNMLGRDVLDADRHPAVEFRGRYVGTLDSGRLTGDVTIRGAARRLEMPVTVSRVGDEFVATGLWEGRLSDLGIKPFKALLGALKLDDWARLRLDARFARRD